MTSHPTPPAADHDPFELVRFVEAQSGSYSQALDELRRGRKRGHWMWFVFPQLTGPGRARRPATIPFQQVLDRWFGGDGAHRTDSALQAGDTASS